MNLGDLGVVSLLKNRTGPYIAQSSESNKKPIYVLTQNDIGTLIAYGSEKGWRVNTFALIDNHISSSIIHFIHFDRPTIKRKFTYFYIKVLRGNEHPDFSGNGLVNFNCHESCPEKCDPSKFEVWNNGESKFEPFASLFTLCLDKGKDMIISYKRFEKNRL